MLRPFGVLGALGAAFVLLASAAASAVQNPWTGRWARPAAQIGGAPNGVTTLAQNGSSVTGSFNWGGGGTMQGTVSGGTLSGVWTQSSARGTFRLVIAPDARSFTGPWQGTEGDFKGQGGTWSGTYIGGGEPRTPTAKVYLWGFNLTAKGRTITRTGDGSGSLTLVTRGSASAVEGLRGFVRLKDVAPSTGRAPRLVLDARGLAGPFVPRSGGGGTVSLRLIVRSSTFRNCARGNAGVATLVDGGGARADSFSLSACGVKLGYVDGRPSAATHVFVVIGEKPS